MNAPAIEWKLLTSALLVLGLSLLVDVGMIVGGMQYRDEAEEHLDKLHKTIATLQKQKKEMSTQSRILAEIMPRYERLRQRGLVGVESRMGWMESLKEAEQSLKLPAPIRYKLEPARPLVPPFPPPPNSGFQLFSSRMELTLGLLHEGDLFNLIDFLEKKRVGVYHIRQCGLRHQPRDPKEGAATGPGPGVNLQGGCVMEWFSLRETEVKNR